MRSSLRLVNHTHPTERGPCVLLEPHVCMVAQEPLLCLLLCKTAALTSRATWAEGGGGSKHHGGNYLEEG